MGRLSATTAVVALSGLLGCLGSSAELPKLSSDAVIVAFGDSLTYGTGVARHQSYPSVLGALTGRQVINAGVPGEVSGEGLRRLRGVVARQRPDLVVLCHGGNDILRRRDRSALAANLRAMVEYLQAEGVAAVILGVPDPGIFLTTVDLYHDVAREYGVPIDGEIIPALLGDNDFKSDQIHFNEAGYQRMAEAVHQLLRSHGAL